MVKSRVVKAIFLSLLAVNPALSMDFDEVLPKGTHSKTVPHVQEDLLTQMPPEVIHPILKLLPAQDFFAFKQVSQTSYEMADDPVFYINEDPIQLIEQLKKTIDFDRKKFHLKKLLPFISRTQNPGERFYHAGMLYFEKKEHLFNTQTTNPTDLLKQWQPYGLALWLAACAGHKMAEIERRKLMSSQQPFNPYAHKDQVFFHLIPPNYPDYLYPLFEINHIDFLKLTYHFLNFKKKIAQNKEHSYVLYKQTEVQTPHFQDVFRHVQNILRAYVTPEIDDKIHQMLRYFREKQLRLHENHINTLRTFLEKKGASQEESALNRILKEAMRVTGETYIRTDHYDEDSKADYFLKAAPLFEEAGEKEKAAELYHYAGVLSKHRASSESIKWFLKAASLFEELDQKQRAAGSYKDAVYLSEDKSNKLTWSLKAASLFEELDHKGNAADLYNVAAINAQNRTQRTELFLKAASFLEQVYEIGRAAIAYRKAAISTPDKAQKVAYSLKAASLFEEKRYKPERASIDYARAALFTQDKAQKADLFSKAITLCRKYDKKSQALVNFSMALSAEESTSMTETALRAYALFQKAKSKNEALLSSLLLYFYADDLGKKGIWLNKSYAHARALLRYTPQKFASLKEAIENLGDVEKEGLSEYVENFMTDFWPEG